MERGRAHTVAQMSCNGERVILHRIIGQTYTMTTTWYNSVQPPHTRHQTAKATPVTTYNLVLWGTPGYDVTRTSYPGVPRSTSPTRPRTPRYPGVRGMSNLVPRGTPKYDVLPDSDGWATSHVDALCNHHARVRSTSTRTPHPQYGYDVPVFYI